MIWCHWDHRQAAEQMEKIILLRSFYISCVTDHNLSLFLSPVIWLSQREKKRDPLCRTRCQSTSAAITAFQCIFIKCMASHVCSQCAKSMESEETQYILLVWNLGGQKCQRICQWNNWRHSVIWEHTELELVRDLSFYSITWPGRVNSPHTWLWVLQEWSNPWWEVLLKWLLCSAAPFEDQVSYIHPNKIAFSSIFRQYITQTSI